VRELTDAERLAVRLEGQAVVLRRAREGRYVRGRCLAIDGLGGGGRRDGVLYLLIEVSKRAEVEWPYRRAG